MIWRPMMNNPSNASTRPVSLFLSNHLTHWHRLTKDQQLELMDFLRTQAIEAGWGDRIELLTLSGTNESGEHRRRQIDEWMDDLPDSINYRIHDRCRHLYMSRLHAIQRVAPLAAAATRGSEA